MQEGAERGGGGIRKILLPLLFQKVSQPEILSEDQRLHRAPRAGRRRQPRSAREGGKGRGGDAGANL